MRMCLDNEWLLSFHTSVLCLTNFCFAGVSAFSAQDLDFLALGESKTKMLLSSLTKLNILEVQVSDGQIVGYSLK